MLCNTVDLISIFASRHWGLERKAWGSEPPNSEGRGRKAENPKWSPNFNWAFVTDQWFPGKKSSLQEWVWQDHHGDRSSLHEDFGELSDSAPCSEAGERKFDQEKAVFRRPIQQLRPMTAPLLRLQRPAWTRYECTSILAFLFGVLLTIR